jgi:putative ABC transport system permease protein
VAVVFRLAWREIRNHPRFAAFFAVNLALGFAGFVALDAFEDSVARALTARSQSYLGADVAITSSRPLLDQEVVALDEEAGAGARSSRAVVLFSMAGSGAHARLVELRAIDAAFPLYGEIGLEAGALAEPAAARRALREEPGAWIDPALLSQLGVAVGGQLRIGLETFRVLGAIARDGGRATSGFSIAPRVYIDLDRLDATGLVATGSRVEHQRLYRLAPDAESVEIARAMRRAVSDPRVTARSHEEATRDLARSYGAVTRYLGLVALVAVFLAGLGAAHLFRAHLVRRVSDLAILMSLGATRTRAQAIFLVQLALLGLAAAGGAAAIGALLLPLLVAVAGDATPPGFEPRVGLRSAATVAVLATLGSSAACLPLIARLRRLRPAQLFAEQAQPALASEPRDAAWWLPAAAGFWAIACWRADSIATGSVFTGVFAAAAVLLAATGLALLAVLGAVPRPARQGGRRPTRSEAKPSEGGPLHGIARRLALRELARSRVRTLSGFVSLGLCALLVSLVPQLRAVLDRDLETPEGSALPSLFLFDIQPEQREALTAHVEARGSKIQRLSPLVRARLDRVDGAPIPAAADEEAPPGESRLSRDGDEQAHRIRSRRYNLTYRQDLTDSELLRAGRAFSGSWDPRSARPAEMSLEIDFAEQLGVGLGDTLRFDVQGVPVEGEVVSLREVRWNSFQPNFFVVFQPGVLEDAPAVYLASVPQLPAEQRDALQASLQVAFPNVSSIDVTRAVQRILGLIDQLQWALAGSAGLSLAVGWLLVTALARDAARARRWEINLLKVLGAELRDIRRALDLEFALLGGLAALAGVTTSLAAAAVLARWVVEVPWTPALASLAAPLLGIPLVCVLSARAAARGVLREHPLALLQASPAE